MPLFGASKRRRCFYCNQNTPLESQAGPVRQFECQKCLAVNHLDSNGEITDPPLNATARLSRSPSRYGSDPLPRSNSPPKPTFTFCARCQQNHHVLATAKANLDPPNESSPMYTQYLKELAKLESRYPLVCNKCRPFARDQIIDSVYNAKAQNMLAIMQKTRFQPPSTWAQWKRCGRGWLLWFGGFGWLISVLAQFLWHMFGARASDFESSIHLDDPLSIIRDSSSWFDVTTVLRSLRTRIIDPRVFVLFTSLLPLILVTEILTIWWNPRLRKKFMRNDRGRMIGTRDFYTMQTLLLLMRYCGAYFLQSPSTLSLDMKQFNYAHGSLGTVLLLLSLRSLPMVRLDMRPTVNFQRFDEKSILPDPDSRGTQQEQQIAQLLAQRQERPKAWTGMLTERREIQAPPQQVSFPSRWPAAFISQQSATQVTSVKQRPPPLPTPPMEVDSMDLDTDSSKASPGDDVFRMSSALRGWLPRTPTMPDPFIKKTKKDLRARNNNLQPPKTFGRRNFIRPSIMDEADDSTDAQSMTTEVQSGVNGDRIHAKQNQDDVGVSELQLAPTRLWLNKDLADTGLEEMFATVLGPNSFSDDDDEEGTDVSRNAAASRPSAQGVRLWSWLGSAALWLFPLVVLATCAIAVKTLR